MTKKKRELSDAQYQKMYGRPKNTGKKTETKKKVSQSSSSGNTKGGMTGSSYSSRTYSTPSKPASSQSSYTPTRTTTVSGKSASSSQHVRDQKSASPSTSRQMTSQDRINQKSYGTTTPRVRKRTTPTNFRARGSENQRNAQAQMNLKQTKAQEARERIEQNRKDRAARVQAAQTQKSTGGFDNTSNRLSREIRERNANEWESVKNKSKAEQQAWFTQKAQEAVARHNPKATETLKKFNEGDLSWENASVGQKRDILNKKLSENAEHSVKSLFAEWKGLAERATRTATLKPTYGISDEQREKAIKKSKDRSDKIKKKIDKEQLLSAQTEEGMPGWAQGLLGGQRQVIQQLPGAIATAATGGAPLFSNPALGNVTAGIADIYLRTYEANRGNVLKKWEQERKSLEDSGDFTKEELDEIEKSMNRKDFINALGQSFFEGRSEGISDGAGTLAGTITGGKGLIKSGKGVFGALKSYLGETFEEDVNGIAGAWWSNLIYGNEFQDLNDEQIRRSNIRTAKTYWSGIESEEDLSARLAAVNSKDFVLGIKDSYEESGMPSAVAAMLANHTKQLVLAEAEGDEEKIEAANNAIINIINANGGDVREHYTMEEALKIRRDMAFSIGMQAGPGAYMTSQMGNQIKDQQGIEYVSKMADYVKKYNESESASAASIKDSIDSGKDISGTSVYDITGKAEETIAQNIERQEAKKDVAVKKMAREDLRIDPVQYNEDGTYDFVGPETSRRFEALKEEAKERIIPSMQELDMDEETLDLVGEIAASQSIGSITVNEIDQLIENPEMQTAFELATGIDLKDYVVRNRKGAVNQVKTNIAIQEGLLSQASENYVESARLEQEAWNDEARGEVQKAMSERLHQTMSKAEIANGNGNGDVATAKAMGTVDPRDRTKFMFMATAAPRVYSDARYKNDEWDDVKAEYKEIYKGLDQSALKGIFEAAKEDKQIAETENYGKPVKAGEPISKNSLKDVGPVRVPGKVIDLRTDISSNKLSENVFYYKAAVIFGADFTLVDSYNLTDTRGRVVYSNSETGEQINEDELASLNDNEKALYAPVQVEGAQSGNGIILNTNEGIRRNIEDIAKHETIHWIRMNAPDEFKALARYLQDKLYSVDPEAFMQTIQAKQKQYKSQDLTMEAAMEELIAEGGVNINWDNLIEDIQTAPAIQDKPTFFEMLKNAFKDVIDKFRSILSSDAEITDEAREATLDQLLELDDGYKLLVNAARAAKADQANQAINDWQDAVNAESGATESFSLSDENMTVSDGTARWTDSRIDSLIREYGARIDENYSKAWAVMMRPEDFLKLTITDETLEKWKAAENETRPLDEEQLAWEGQTPFLIIDANATDDSSYRIDGHEGRHRMLALMEAGIKSVPVALQETRVTKYSKTKIPNLTLAAQDFTGEGGVNNDARVEVSDLVPIKESNRDELIEKFGGEADVRFSLNEPVERVKDLVAVHNVWPDDLVRSLNMGGLAMPSIAVTKADMGHEKYGSISLLFHSDVIDPEMDSDNRVWGGDAYTPTFPTIYRKFSDAKGEEIEKRLLDILGFEDRYEFADNVKGLRLPAFDEDNLGDKLRYGTEPREAYANDLTMQLAYLTEQGNAPAVPMMPVKMQNRDEAFWHNLAAKISEEDIENYSSGDLSVQERIDKFAPIIGQTIKEELEDKDFYKKQPNLLEKYDDLKFADVDNYMMDLRRFYKEGGMPQRVDEGELRDALEKRLNQAEYSEWLDNLFDGIVEKEGIWNEGDIFDEYGNRKEWEELHEPVTVQNVVAAMKRGLAAGQGNFGGVIKGAAQKEYQSLDELREDEDRLQMLDDEEYYRLMEEAEEKVNSALEEINEHNPQRSSYDYRSKYDIGSYVAEILNTTRDRNDIQEQLLSEYEIEATDEMMDELMEGIDAIAEIPTGYFEAKPAKAIPFTDVAAAIVPDVKSGVSAEIRERLEAQGVRVVEYDHNSEEDRKAKLNEVADAQQLKFSLSPEQQKLDNDYMSAVENYQKLYDADDIGWIKAENEIAKMVDQAAFNAGYATKAYHGTPSEPFNVFNRDYIEHGRLHGDGFYFSPYEDIANQYGETRAYYLKTGLLNEEDLLSDQWLGAQDYKDFTSVDEALAFYEEKQEEYEKYGQGMARFRPDVSMANGHYRVLFTTVGVFDQGLILVAMEPEYAKFAEPITYAEDGSVIPLSQRFNSDNQDLRYSLPTSDAEGTALSNGQIEFFEQSKVRNGAGQLKVMLHGTDADFTEFDPSKARPGTLGRAFYFSDSSAHAGQYGNVGRYYLNLVNPLMAETRDITKEQLRRFVEYLAEDEDYGIENYGADATVDSVTDSVWGGTDFVMLRDLNLSAVGDFAEAVKVFNRVNGTNYDGIITDVETAAFYPEQIKRTDNLNPTLSKDTRYSITDADGKDLSDGQVTYFRNSKARDELGRLVRVYHSTDNGGFTIFDPSKSDDKRSIFFTSNYRMSQSYIRNGGYKDFNAMEFGLPEIEPNSIMDMQDVIDYLSNLTTKQKDLINLVIYDSEGYRYDSWSSSNKNDSIEAFYKKHGDRFDNVEGIIDDAIEGTLGKFTDSDELYSELESCVKYINEQLGETGRNESGTYSCYLNLENPMIIDCKGANWDSISEDGFEHLYVRTLQGNMDDPTDLIYYISDEDGGIGRPFTSIDEIREEYGDGFADQIEEIDEAYNGQLELYTWDGAAFNPEEEGYWPAEGDTRYWCLEAEARGYDGVIFLNLSDNGSHYSNETGDVYVAFNSNQVKDVNNLNPTENPDIRYSIVDEDEAKSRMAYEDSMDNSYEALAYYEQMIEGTSEDFEYTRPIPESRAEALYAGLQAEESRAYSDSVLEEDAVRMAKSKQDFFNSLNAKWNARWTTGGEVLDIKSVKANVRNLVMGVMQNSATDSQYKSDLVKKTLLDLKTAYQFMKQDRPEIASALLYHSAQRMIDNVEFYVDGTFEQYKELRDYLRRTKISLGEEYWSDVDYDAFRKANFGRLKLVKGRTNVDQVYQELEGMFPEWFSEDETMTIPDQLLQIDHVLDSIQPYKEAYSSEEAAELAFDIADDLYEIMVNGEELTSLADRYKQSYERKVNAMKQRHAEAMLRIRRARDIGVLKERAKWRAREEVRKERAAHREVFDSITKSYKTLTDRLRSNTADKNIPEQYKKELAGLLAAFDLQTVASKKREAKTYHRSQNAIKMSAIRTALRQIETRSQKFFHMNDAIVDIIDELLGVNSEYPAATSIEGKTIDELSNAELQRIDKLLKALIHEFNTYKNVRIQDRNEMAQDIADAQVSSALEHANKFGAGTDWFGIRGGLDRVLNLDEVTPAYLFRQIDRKNEGLGLMWKEVGRAHDKYIRNTDQLSKWMEEITGKYHNKGKGSKKYGADQIAEWRRSRSQVEFNLTNGSIKLTPAQMMSLAMLAKRPQAYQHMVGAGVVAAPVNFQAKMETDLKRKTNRALPLVLTDADIKLIVSQLTPEQRKMADDLQQLMANQMAEWGNEASMDVIGIRLFEEPDYFPIKSDRAALEKDLTPDQFEQAIRNFGFTKAVQPGARNAIMIDDIFDVVTEHCNNMNLYNSYSKVLNDFMKVYNKHTYQEDGSDYTVAQALGHAYSQKVPHFIMTFLKDINGNVSKDRTTGIESMLQEQLANAKKASVFANVRVFLQQFSAIGRAFYVISPKYLKAVKLSDVAKGLTPKVDKAAMDEMFEHCPIAKWKSWGYYDINMGKQIEDIIMNEGNFLEDVATQAYGAADNVTWTAIWQMVKDEMKDTHPDVVEGSDEFWYQCNERMREIVDLTQVVDSPMHRSHAMRSKSFIVKMATSFMAEPTLTFNMIRDGYIQAREAWILGDKKAAAAHMSRAMTAVVFQTMLLAPAAAIADALRGKSPDGDDDEDKTFFALWWANTIENFKDELKIWNKIYYLKDISSIFEGYEAWNLGTQGITNFVKGYNQMTKKLTEGSKTPWWNIYQNLWGGIGYMTGIPVKTLMKDGRAVFEFFGGQLPESLVGDNKKSDPVVDKDSAFGKIIAPKSGDKDKSASVVNVSPEDHWYDYENNPITVKDGSALDKLLNHFGLNLTETEKAAAIQAKENEEFNDKSEEIAQSVADYSGEEKAKKTWSKVSTYMTDTEGKSLNDIVAEGDYYSLLRYRQIYIDAGNDAAYFDERVMAASKKALKTSIVYDATSEQVTAQERIRDYMLDNGMSEAEISEIAYKSDTARDLKVAMRLGDEELVKESLEPLVNAGLSRDDFDKCWKNRNRVNLKTYEGRYKDQLKSTGNYIFPVDGTITSDFGHRASPGGIGSTNHQGIDIGASQGTPVAAADGGTVVMAGWYGGYGKTVQIQHDDGTITQYSHLSWWDVNEGDTVGQGQEIGLVGSTGNSTGPHLHLGVIKNGDYVDPKEYFNTADKAWEADA